MNKLTIDQIDPEGKREPERERILNEIRKLAAKNSGKPPGRRLFERETEITEGAWRGVYWARWSDALAEAGYAPNKLTGRIDEQLLMEKLALAVRHYGRIPSDADLRLYRRNVAPEFPDPSIVQRRFGTTKDMLDRLAEYVGSNPEFGDVAAIIGDRSEISEKESHSASVEGHVYLIKSGAHYKIGRSDNLERRVKEIRTALPEAGTLVHSIRTDDPAGIEAYWHRRFADRRAPNGEWFKLSSSDVKTFKRRKSM